MTHPRIPRWLVRVTDGPHKGREFVVLTKWGANAVDVVRADRDEWYPLTVEPAGYWNPATCDIEGDETR